jgi:hypothetical protein
MPFRGAKKGGWARHCRSNGGVRFACIATANQAPFNIHERLKAAPTIAAGAPVVFVAWKISSR